MIKKIVYISILLVIVFSVALLSFLHYRATKIADKYKTAYSIERHNFDVFKQAVDESVSKTVLLEQRKLLPTYYYKYNKPDIDSVSIQFFINRLLLIVPEMSCNSCYDDVYDFIRYANDSLNIQILVLTTFNRYREISNILDEYSLKNDLYYIKANWFFDNTNEIGYAPYFICINQYQTGCHIFIPQPNHPYLAKTYLQYINQRYETDRANL